MKPLPLYRCHKEVRALKIEELQYDSMSGSYLAIPAESGYAPIVLDIEFMRRHRPEVGGYYVVYADGYASFSPAKAFEEGYSKA